MATIKYQQRIHEAFAKEIAGNPAVVSGMLV